MSKKGEVGCCGFSHVEVSAGCIKNSEVYCFDLHVSIPVNYHTASLEQSRNQWCLELKGKDDEQTP